MERLSCFLLSHLCFGYLQKHSLHLQKENERLILKNDSLHMLQIKVSKELKMSRLRIDSLSLKFDYRSSMP